MFTKRVYDMAKAVFVIGALLMAFSVLVLFGGYRGLFHAGFVWGAGLVLISLFGGLLAEISMAVGGDDA